MNQKDILISLNPESWSYIINLLAKQPFNEVSGLINEIQRQANEAAAAKNQVCTPE